MDRKRLEELISKDESEKGIEMLIREGIEHCPSFQQKELILLSSRFNSLKKKHHLGVLTSEQYQIERNKLNLDLLHFVKTFQPKTINKIVEPPPASPPQSLEGMRFGNYELLKFLGGGGFGNVYLAKQLHLHHTCAIKVSHEVKVGKEFLDDIISFSIRSLKSLKHKNIITIHDVGEVEVEDSPRIYIVMDYVSGGTLDELPKQNLTREAVERRIEIFRKVCAAIDAAHNLTYADRFGFAAQGIYHGDIKPQNIMLDEQNEPIVIDFMFVDMNSLYEIMVNTPQKMDRSTAAFGTPGYMPFEQEQNGIVNRQTDVYSLGILLFEIFSSTRFEELTDKSNKSIKRHLKKENPNLPGYISEIIFESTRKDPAERYETVSRILGRLERGNASWWRRFMKK